ncbi:MAG: radical SAM protein [Nitrospirae bacterium]|nr:radical SAM protein [Nitrospirota bacterium]
MNRKLIEKADALLSKEKGTVFKDPGGKINICLIYPNTYYVGMSNLGFQGIYTLLNERDDVVCERSFLPDEEDINEYIRTETEIFSLESKRPLNRFDIIAFSVSFENDYPNILRILELSNIPIRSGERKASHPLIVLGGACAFFNPEPIADFMDICFIGEAEEMLQEFLDVYNGSETRKVLYERVSGIEGVYVPRSYRVGYDNNNILRREKLLETAPEKIRRRFIKDISTYRLRPSIITTETEFSSMFLIEAMRGCPWKCRFCVAGHIYNPPRKKDISIIKGELIEALKLTDRIGLVGPSLTDYPYINDVLRTNGVDFSITSLRASRKSAEIVGLMKGHKSVSIAPEAGTERLRTVIDKKITEDDIIETSKLIFSEGIENLRLYFMIGLPTETEDDIEGIVSLAKKIRNVSEKGSITITLSTFVPKPFTPFQWHSMERIDVVKQRLRTIKKLLLPIKGIRVFHDVQKYAYMQGLFSIGDRRISNVLESMLKINDWRKACIDSGIDPDFYILRKKDFSENLPWDFIESGLSKEKLWEEFQKAITSNPE